MSFMSSLDDPDYQTPFVSNPSTQTQTNMSLESVLADLVVALNANTAALKSAPSTAAAPAAVVEKEKKATKPKDEPKKEDPKPAETAAVVFPTVNDVRNAAQAVLDASAAAGRGLEDYGWPGYETPDKRLLKPLAQKYGKEKVSDVPEDKRAEVIAHILAQVAIIKAQATASASNAI